VLNIITVANVAIGGLSIVLYICHTHLCMPWYRI